jgi:hypothetical protein
MTCSSDMEVLTVPTRKSQRANNDPVRLAFVGDICLAGGLQTEIRNYGVHHPFALLGDAFASADLVIGNLECCISDRPCDADQALNIMQVEGELATGLINAGVNVFSLSNNHILDGGQSALRSTINFLEKHGLRHFGAGNDLEEAERPLIIECKGRKIAFLGACDVPQVHATKSSCGVPPLKQQRLGHRVASCKTQADFVIVSIHADLEFTSYPAPSRVRLSRWLIEMGADLVIQHHPHVCQGVEMHNGGLIAYSLGNFVFRVEGNEYFRHHDGTRWGVILSVELDHEKSTTNIDYQLVPVTINSNNQPMLSIDSERQHHLSMLTVYSKGLADWNVIRHARMVRCLVEAKNNMYGLYYLLRRRGFLAAVKAAITTLASPYERKWIYGLLSFGYF